jgi:hypothetical protein
MSHFGYRRCVACHRSITSDVLAETRLEFAKEMLPKYPTKEDWRSVRFTDESHLGFGPEVWVWVTRKPGKVHCPDCVQEAPPKRKEHEKKVHVWAAIGYDYKSELYRYHPLNSNGAINQQIYLGLLKKEVSGWPQDWVLEEDGASGRGKGEKSELHKWKKTDHPKFYFSSAHSPDLAHVENC